MSQRVRVMIDGCGALTSETILHHLDQPDFQARAEVVAVCDILPERAKGAAERHEVPAWFTDTQEMLDKVEADAVLIIVPHHLHAEHALAALRAGRHVYVQKPMAPTVAEARAIGELARERGLKVVAAPGQVLWPMYDQIAEVIEQGEIGHPFLAIPPLMGWGGLHVGFPNHPGWFFGKEAGPLRDHGGYGFQTLVRLFGPARRVTAFSGTAVGERFWNGEPFACDGHDNSAVLLDFGGTTFGLMPEAWCDTAPAARILRIQGLTGSIQTTPETFNHLDILPLSATVVRMGRLPLTLKVDPDRIPMMAGRHPHLGHTHVYGDILHLVDCIERDEEPRASAARGLHFVELVEAAFRAAETGMAQELSAVEF